MGFHLPIRTMSKPHFISSSPSRYFNEFFCCRASHSYFVRKLIVLQCCDMSSLCWCLWHVSDPQKFVFGVLARFFLHTYQRFFARKLISSYQEKNDHCLFSTGGALRRPMITIHPIPSNPNPQIPLKTASHEL